MDKFTLQEFYNLVFKSKEPAVPVVINKDVKKYINKECIFSSDYLWLTPLAWAAIYNHLEVLKYLVENGADIAKHGEFAVRMAAKHGNLAPVKYLVENGADITMLYGDAIRWAVSGNHTNIVKYLLSTNIYSENCIWNVMYYHACMNSEIEELLNNYKQFHAY